MPTRYIYVISLKRIKGDFVFACTTKASAPRRQQTGDGAAPHARLIAMGPSSHPSPGGTEWGDETSGCCPTSEGNGASVPLQPRCHHEDVPGGGGGGNIGTESQGKVWIRRTEPNYRAAAPGCGAGGRRDGRRGRRHRAVLSESSSSSAGPFSCTLCAASSGSRRSAASRPPMWMDGSSKCSRPAAGTDSGVRGCGAPRGDACHRVP